MKIIIGGAGEVGTHLAKLLGNGNHDVIVLDEDDDSLREINHQCDVLTVNGSPTSIQDLKEVISDDIDLFIAVTPYESTNITACLLAKKMGVKKTISRVNGPEYVREENQHFFTEMGIDSLIYPENLAAIEVSKIVRQTGVTKVVDFSNEKLKLFAFRLEENSPLIDKSLIQLAQENPDREFQFVAVTRDGETIIPRGEAQLKEGDLAFAITTQKGKKQLLKNFDKKEYMIKNVMILGGSKIGKKIAQLLESKVNTKLLEQKKDKSFELADELDRTLVLNTDGRKIDHLLEEGLANMDAFIAVTGSSETNILASVYARSVGVKKVIAEIENLDYIDIAEKIGIESIINKKSIAASHIFSFTMNAEVTSVQCLNETQAEVLEFIVKEKSKITRSNLQNINFPKNAQIGGIIRGDMSMIAKGDVTFNPGDKVVVFTLPDAINAVEKFFK